MRPKSERNWSHERTIYRLGIGLYLHPAFAAMKIDGLDGEMEPVYLYISKDIEVEDESIRHIWFVSSDGKPIKFKEGGNVGIKILTKVKPKKFRWTDIFKP